MDEFAEKYKDEIPALVMDQLVFDTPFAISEVELSQDQKDFFSFYRQLGHLSEEQVANAPPELQALAESRNLLAGLEQRYADITRYLTPYIGSTEKAAVARQLGNAQLEFENQYEVLLANDHFQEAMSQVDNLQNTDRNDVDLVQNLNAVGIEEPNIAVTRPKV